MAVLVTLAAEFKQQEVASAIGRVQKAENEKMAEYEWQARQKQNRDEAGPFISTRCHPENS